MQVQILTLVLTWYVHVSMYMYILAGASCCIYEVPHIIFHQMPLKSLYFFWISCLQTLTSYNESNTTALLSLSCHFCLLLCFLGFFVSALCVNGSSPACFSLHACPASASLAPALFPVFSLAAQFLVLLIPFTCAFPPIYPPAPHPLISWVWI